MHWIKSAGLSALALLQLACAGQDPVIPEQGPEMKTIYRQALDAGTPQTPVFQSEAERLCQQLPVAGDTLDCTKEASEILRQQRLAAHPNPQKTPLDYVRYTRDAGNEIEQLFPRMPNPDLVIYVYPHLATRTRAPIPGYTSVIPLFDRVEYQLPGEIAPLDEQAGTQTP